MTVGCASGDRHGAMHSRGDVLKVKIFGQPGALLAHSISECPSSMEIVWLRRRETAEN